MRNNYNNRLIVLVGFLVCCVEHGNALFGGGMMMKGKKKEPRAAANMVVHHDASTGTVAELTPEQEETSKAAMTCDKMLTKSLSLAIDRKEEAEQARDSYRDQFDGAKLRIQSLETEGAALTKDLKLSKEEIQRMVDSAGAEREEMERKVKESVQEQIASLEKTIKDMATKFDETKQENDRTVQTLAAKAADDIDTLLKQAEQKESKILADHAASVEQIKAQHDAIVTEKDNHIQTAKARASEEKDRLLKELEETEAKLLSEHAMTKAELEELHEQVVVELKAEMTTKEKKAIEDLKAKENHMERQLKMVKQKSQSHLGSLKDDHTKERTSLQNSIKQLEVNVEKMNDEIKIMESKYDAARDEIASWEETHNSRSYCNLTHISEDSWAATMTASKVASEQITVGAAYVAKVSEPHVQMGYELYDQHIREHVEKHYTPVHETHVVPFLAFAATLFSTAGDTIREAGGAAHRGLVTGTRKRVCPLLKKAASTNHSLKKSIHRECQNPAGLLRKFFLVLLAIIALVFRKPVWRAIKGIVCFPFKAMWYCTPLPLLFGRKVVVFQEEAVKETKVKKEAAQ